MVGPVAALGRAVPQSMIDHTSVWLLVAAGLVGFALAWLAFELHKAWTPESFRSQAEPTRSPAKIDALEQVVPTLVDQVAQLRRELAEVRASDARHLLAGLERARAAEDPRIPRTRQRTD